MILDCDLLIGRDITTGCRQNAADLRARLAAAGIDGGAVTGLRALSYDPETGNREAGAAARDHGWRAVCGGGLRNPVEAGSRMEAAAAGGARAVGLAADRRGPP